MKLKSWITTLSSMAIASLVLVVSPANAGHNKAVYDYARVVSVEPVIRYVTVQTPVRECWEDVHTYTTSHYNGNKAGKTLFGAIVGGVIGHQFGSGRGNDAATVAGALIGAGVANSRSRHEPDYYTTRHSQPVRRCHTTYETHEEERIDGYHVIYAYHGRKYATRTPYDPGKKIRIRVDVRPAPYTR
ncbi:MAG: glycine zipper 2TM domain-containing protein [Woeseiaceae bacterium]|nr:glycine zipper 2TM domain-containing protein [Woeseiaceae bacterium]